MAKKKSTSPEKKAAQKMRTTANKIRAWKKHLESHPHDLVGKEKLELLLREKK